MAKKKGNAGNNVLKGTAGADLLFGLGGNDKLIGRGGNDRLIGGSGDDTLIGGAGNDRLVGGSGNDSMVGGSGVDRAIFSGNSGDYTITNTGGIITVDGPDGTDTLSSVELLQFADTTIDLRVNQAPAFTSSANFSVSENATLVGTVTANDLDGDALTYFISGGADAASFTIDAVTGALSFTSPPDFEAPGDAGGDNVYDVEVSVNDGNGHVVAQAIAVTVTDVAEAPAFTSGPAFNAPENGTAVGTVAATDPQADAVTFSITGGADAALFSINATTGALSFKSAPDFESPTDTGGDNVYDIEVTADDGNGNISTQAIAVTVTNKNEAPTLTSGTAFNVNENAAAVTTITATDPDAGDPLTFSLSGADAGLFNIDPNTGALSFKSAPNFEAPADAGADNTYDVNVQVKDAGGLIDAAAISVTVQDVNEAPTISTSSLSLNENATAAGTVLSSDPDLGDALTYSIDGSGADDALFSIDANTGALTFLVAPDAEAPADTGGTPGDNVYEVAVKVTDKGGLTATKTVSVTVNDVNEFAPTITTTALTADENQSSGGTVTASDADASSTLTYSIFGGNDAAAFTIDASTGALTFVTAPDFEAPADFDLDGTYDLQIKVEDQGGLFDIKSVTVQVKDVNEAPSLTGPFAFNADENQTTIPTSGATIAGTLSDPDAGDSATYSITGGADAALFAIDANTGELSFLAAPDAEAPADANKDNAYEIEVTATDAGGLSSAAQSVTVTVDGLNDNTPVITSGTFFTTVENVKSPGIFITATDADVSPSDTLTYSLLAGKDKGDFNIDATTGELSFKAAPDFENPVDGNKDNTYAVDVQVSDGVNTAVKTINVTVTDGSENAPVITSPATFSVNENVAAVGFVTATDADPLDTITYEIVGGADAALFSIDAATGALSFKAAPDADTPLDDGGDNVYNIIVEAKDQTGVTSGPQAVQITVNDINEFAPSITTTSFSIEETDAKNTVIGQVLVDDADFTDDQTAPTPLTFAFAGGADDALFSINNATGELKFKGTLDFENPADAGGTPGDNVYEVKVKTTDQGGLTDTKTISVTVTDSTKDHSPVLTSSAAPLVAENTTFVQTVTATDADVTDVLSYSITGGADSALFTIDSNTGDLSFISAPDFETPIDVGGTAGDNIYEVEVTATDKSANTASQTVNVTVTDADQPPVFTSPNTVDVNENTTAVQTVTTTDTDFGDVVTYAIAGSGADDALFTIDANTGALSFIAAPDFENPQDDGADNVYDVDVKATDSFGNVTTQSVAVTVKNVNDIAPVIGSLPLFSINENTKNVGTVTATDVDAAVSGPLTFSVAGGADGGLFSINSKSGVLSFKTAPDFEAPTDADGNNIYHVQVQVSDGLLTDTQDIQVTVNDKAEAPSFTANGPFSIQENGTAVGTVTAIDPDGTGTITYSLNGGADAGLFSIDSNTGELSFLSAPDFEVPTDTGNDNVYDVKVKAFDGSQSTNTNISVTVTDDATEVFATTLGPVQDTIDAVSDNISFVFNNSGLFDFSHVELANGDVTLTVVARGDLENANETGAVSLLDAATGTLIANLGTLELSAGTGVIVHGGNDVEFTQEFTIAQADWNNAVNGGTAGEVELLFDLNGNVSAGNASDFISIALSYDAIT